jgi:hypothetical protein
MAAVKIVSYIRRLVDEQYRTIPAPSWSPPTRSDDHYTETTAR